MQFWQERKVTAAGTQLLAAVGACCCLFCFTLLHTLLFGGTGAHSLPTGQQVQVQTGHGSICPLAVSGDATGA